MSLTFGFDITWFAISSRCLAFLEKLVFFHAVHKIAPTETTPDTTKYTWSSAKGINSFPVIDVTNIFIIANIDTIIGTNSLNFLLTSDALGTITSTVSIAFSKSSGLNFFSKGKSLLAIYIFTFNITLTRGFVFLIQLFIPIHYSKCKPFLY